MKNLIVFSAVALCFMSPTFPALASSEFRCFLEGQARPFFVELQGSKGRISVDGARRACSVKSDRKTLAELDRKILSSFQIGIESRYLVSCKDRGADSVTSLLIGAKSLTGASGNSLLLHSEASRPAAAECFPSRFEHGLED